MIKRIGKPFEDLYHRVQPYFLRSHRRAYRQMLDRGLADHREGEPIVVCDLADTAVDAVGGRYYSGMVRDLIDAGYFPVFVAHRTTVSSFVIKGKKSFLLENRFGVVRSLKELRQPYFLITDRTREVPALALKVVKMVYERRLCRSEEDIEMPFFVHPYVGARIPLPHPYRVEETRKARMFFGGNTTESRYSKDLLGKHYGLLTRRQVLDTATETAGDRIYRPADANGWLASSERRQFVMFETQKGGVPRDRWIDALASSDFFLACPGVEMPLCHNLIEAMAGGSIPILQYAAYLPVPLQNRVNALTFDGFDSLRDAVNAALSMTQEEVVAMRANVHEYYRKYLAPGCFARRLFDGPLTRKNLLFNVYRVPRPADAQSR